jgi:hypothetical protein
MAKKKRRVVKASTGINALSSRIETSWKNFMLFLILFIFSFVLYSVSSTDIFLNLFGILSILFGFVAFALLIVLLVFLILKRRSR